MKRVLPETNPPLRILDDEEILFLSWNWELIQISHLQLNDVKILQYMA